MASAKDIVLKVIPSNVANAFVKKHHYSGKVVNNSKLHFGCFLGGVLGGVMSYGSPLDKRKVLGLVHTSEDQPVLWNEMLELNRMAFSDILPRNSESRCIAISFRLIKKNAPHIKWVLSFSDGSQCGDGTIYRASGFLLTSIKKNNQIWEAPEDSKGNRERVSRVTVTKGKNISSNGRASMKKFVEAGFKPIPGFQLRYIKLLYPDLKLNCESIPFSHIDEIGAGMYKGEKISLAERQKAHEAKGDEAPGYQPGERRGGSDPCAQIDMT
ncbi:MAG: Mom family adenine methylcarbamoylation protein [Thiotrichales bacterium]